MANFVYGQFPKYHAMGALNWRETAVTAPPGTAEANVRAMLVCTTTTAGPAGTNNGGTAAEDVLAVGSFTTLGEYDSLVGASYDPGFSASGRKTCTAQLVTFNTAKNRIELDLGDLTWTALGAAATNAVAVLFFFQPTAAATDADLIPLIWIDTVASGQTFPFNGSGGDAVLQIGANGLIWIGDRNIGDFT